MNWDKALNDFARILPTNSFLTSIQMTAPVTAAAAVPSVPPTPPTTSASTDGTATRLPRRRRRRPECRPSRSPGRRPSTPGVALVMDRLALLPWLSNVTLDIGRAAGHGRKHLRHVGDRLGGEVNMARMNGLMGVVVSSFAVLVVVLVGWFFFVSPQRSKADRLTTQVDAAHTELTSDTTLIATAKKQNTLGNAKAAEKALPDTPQVSNILRELTDLAAASRTELESISPGTPVAVGSSQALPLSLSFKGRYFGLQKLLKLLRQSASVSGNTIVAKGAGCTPWTASSSPAVHRRERTGRHVRRHPGDDHAERLRLPGASAGGDADGDADHNGGGPTG